MILDMKGLVVWCCKYLHISTSRFVGLEMNFIVRNSLDIPPLVTLKESLHRRGLEFVLPRSGVCCQPTPITKPSNEMISIIDLVTIDYRLFGAHPMLPKIIILPV